MARDPPMLLDASPHLRDLTLTPSTIKHASPVIIHPQLRDLILPLERGRILYPRGGAIEELSWLPPAPGPGPEDEDEDEDEDGMDVDIGAAQGSGTRVVEPDHQAQTRTLVKLNFTPNCIVANKTIIAAGGQHGELYITNSPLPSSSFSTSAPKYGVTKPLRPFTINLSLQSRSINNSMILLPTYPGDWAKEAENRRIGRRWSSSAGGGDGYEEAMELDSVLEEHQEEGQETDVDLEDEDDEHDDEDDEEGEDDDEELDQPQSPLTYPNTVPFLHAPRMGGGSWSSSLGAGPSFSHSHSQPRRAASFSERDRHSHPRPRASSSSLISSSRPNRLERRSFSISRPGLPPVEYVTSRPLAGSSRSDSSAGPGGRPDQHDHHPQRDRRASQQPHAHAHAQSYARGETDEPRLLISNNDLTVKMFSLRAVPPQVNSSYSSASTATHTDVRPGRFNQDQGSLEQTFDDWSRGPDGPVASRIARERLNRQLNEFQRIVGVPIRHSAFANFTPAPAPPGVGAVPPRPGPGQGQGQAQQKKERDERKLVRIGGSKFKCAINHSSLSPDLRNMVSVGDSDEVYLFEVVDGGREFRKVATYKAATDSGFSTAWSRDGRKFAVASQDGQVTVWDHRSSKPLAKFYSSRGPSSPSSSSAQPSFSSDLYSSLAARHPPILVDPVTGDTRVGSSSSGREAARVVKFSPEGAPRDLLVFSEENTNIHVIDAQTLNTHVVLPVPSPSPLQGNNTQGARLGHEGGTWGIAGIAFDPTGQFLYSGTERTVVEWDMRGGPRGEGTWDMA